MQTDKGDIASVQGEQADSGCEPSNGAGNALRQKDFSAHNRELKYQVDPDTQEPTELMTRKQYEEMIRKEWKSRLRDF